MNREQAERCTILRGLVGSTVHGLNVNDGIEDRDEMGICVEPLEEAMSLGSPRSYLLDVRRGRVSEQECLTRAGELEQELTDLATTSLLPDEPEQLRVEEWVLDVYRRRWSVRP
jgi:hypothetical protein